MEIDKKQKIQHQRFFESNNNNIPQHVYLKKNRKKEMKIIIKS